MVGGKVNDKKKDESSDAEAAAENERLREGMQGKRQDREKIPTLRNEVYAQRQKEKKVRTMKKSNTCELLDEAIKDEKKGVFDYVKLGRKLVEDGHVKDAKKVGRIATDEASHELKLMSIRKKVCKR